METHSENVELKNMTNELDKKIQQQLDIDAEGDRFSKLPMDVSLDILSRLPLKTISHCRWVSKTWYNFILHRRLAELHFARFRNALPCAIFHSRYQGTHLIDPDCLHTQQTVATAYDLDLKELRKNFTISNGWNCFEVVGTVNGMICFSPERCDYEPAPYYICNPITKDYVLLPKSPKIDVEPIGSGFGFDSLNNVYKVVRILKNASEDKNEVEIYTLGSKMWRQVHIGVHYIPFMIRQFNVFLNGCVHWSTSVMVDSVRYETILSFNVAAEEFDLIRMPPLSSTRETILRCLDLIVLSDCLCVVDGGFWGPKDIWVMKVYGERSSWVRQYVFEDKFFFCGWHGFHEALGLNNNLLLFLNEKGDLSYYDYQKKTSKQIMIQDLKGDPVTIQKDCPVYFTGSLFSPKAIEGEHQGSVPEGGL